MRKTFSILVSLLIIAGLSSELFAQWAQNKHAREDAKYVRVLQGAEDVVVDGVEDEIWAMADSVVVGYGQTSYLPGSGYVLEIGESNTGDSANAVCKFLYKKPYIYLLFKVQDKYVGGKEWTGTAGSDGIIIPFRKYPAIHSWVENWDNRVEHFYSWIWVWDTTAATVGDQPFYYGSSEVGGVKDWKRTAAQKERWQAFTAVISGTSNDSLPDVGYISEHRMNVDSLGFNLDGNGDVLPFNFAILDADGFLDSNAANNSYSRTWWGCPWNENWWYAALYIDPDVTTSSPGGVIPPVDYTVPRLNESDVITVDGDISEWKTDNTLHFYVKYQDEAAFDSIKGTGKWASGYRQDPWNSAPTVVDGPAVHYWVTYDDTNLYVAAEVEDQVVTVPGEGNRSDGITFNIASRKHSTENGVLPSKQLTVNIDSSGNGKAADDLIAMVDTAGLEFNLQLGNGTNVNDIAEIDTGYTVELKIPFAGLEYPQDLGDSVVFIGGLVNDLDIFEDAASNYYAKTWWFTANWGGNNQKAPAWVVLGPANPSVGVNDDIQVPTSIKLYDNYPNPFNPSTTIKFSMNVNSDVTLSVYNVLGQLVSVMKKTNVPAGFGEFQFNAAGLSSGVYFYQMEIKNLTNSSVVNSQVKKMVLLK
jgi:hypothetical protein